MTRERPWIKICGITRPADALLAANLGATHLGVNLWPRSSRHVEIGQAREIVDAVAGHLPVTGVFVNESPERIEELAATIGLDLIQLHGDEPEAWVRRLSGRVLRAVRFGEGEGPSPAAVAALSSSLRAWVLDGPTGDRFGGTGRSWRWRRARRFVDSAGAPVLIAGGVRPDNAVRALVDSGAAGVDVASGVESAPGVKDPEKMRRLIEEITGGGSEG